MRLNLNLSGTYFHKIVAPVPMGSGKTQPIEFDAEFKRLSQSEVESLLKQLHAGEIHDRQAVDVVLKGWRGLQDDAGNPAPFTPDNLNTLLSVFPVQGYVLKGFFASLEDAKAKN